ncbi:hypothetical protein [Fibrella forsythiae]|uniref:Uncharacterized protein n=1 Tax=Fibrella forsythiae TaxID=2817061 RepID=A0ABS3JMF9_9BACT|nr:hypothetical protein [Fibrella forsythiae]MBO0951203.1 hypothetical protein [Fibrella forsythiae]
MAFVDDLERVTKAIDTISKEGVPVKVEHSIETNTMWLFMGGLAVVAVVFVVLLGVKDLVIKRRT